MLLHICLVSGMFNKFKSTLAALQNIKIKPQLGKGLKQY